MQPSPPNAPRSGFYPAPGKAFLLRENSQIWLLEKQLVVPNQNARLDGSNGSATIAVQLSCIPGSFYPFGVSLQIFFTDVNNNSAAPGTFEVDLQSSDIDADQHFLTVGTGTSWICNSVNGSNSGRIENSTLWAQYVRAYIKTLPNPVYVWILASR